MADSKRGGRSNDDEFDDNDDNDAVPAIDDDEVIDAEFVDDEPDDRKAGATSSAVARSGARADRRDVKRDDAQVGFVGRIIRFIREVVAEMQKVIYPTRKELLTYTAVVLVFVLVVMSVVSLLDLGFARLMFLVFGTNTTT